MTSAALMWGRASALQCYVAVVRMDGWLRVFSALGSRGLMWGRASALLCHVAVAFSRPCRVAVCSAGLARASDVAQGFSPAESLGISAAAAE